MDQVDPDLGNVSVAQTFRTMIYKYSVPASVFVSCTFLGGSRFIQPIMVEADLYWMKTVYGLQTTFG